MQTCLPRSYLKPVRDEEAESQRKAKSRQARQRRRLTQGVTPSDLKEAKRVIDPSQLEKQKQTGGLRSSTEGQCGQRTFSQEKMELLYSHTVLQQTEHLQTYSHKKLDEEDNWRRTVEDKNDRSTYSVISPSASGACGFTPCLMNCTSPSGIKWKDENENTIYASSQEKIQDHQWISDDSLVHDRISRSDSSGVECSDRPNKTSYTRRDRLASLNKTDDDSTSRSYKKLYEDALAENEKLKARLEDSKQELTKIRSQLDSVTQKQDRISEKPSVLESEKREKQLLEKRVSHMEEELKVLTELKSDNQRLKDENGALIRVISKLSK